MAYANGYGRGNPKADVDWAHIETVVRGGGSIASMARKYKISRQRITQVCQKEGWKERNLYPTDSLPGATNLTLDIMTRSWWGKMEPETVQEALILLGEGHPQREVMEFLGVPRGTWQDYRDKNPQFAQAIRAAQAMGNLKTFGAMANARDTKSDWRAGQELIKLNPDNKESYGESTAGTQINVILKIPDPEGTIIDAVPKKIENG